MSGRAAAPARRRRAWSRITAGVRAATRGVAFFGLMLGGAGLVLALVAPVLLAGAGIGSLFDHGPGSPARTTPLGTAGSPMGVQECDRQFRALDMGVVRQAGERDRRDAQPG